MNFYDRGTYFLAKNMPTGDSNTHSTYQPGFNNRVGL